MDKYTAIDGKFIGQSAIKMHEFVFIKMRITNFDSAKASEWIDQIGDKVDFDNL
jgi:hypothetical protein